MRAWMMAALAGLAGFAAGQDEVVDKKEGPYEWKARHDPNGIGKFYMGREIAHVMGFAGVSWLERPEREDEEAPKKLLAALDLKDGMAVADVGAGSGYHSFRWAKAVGAKGKVFAVDVQKEMVDLLKARIKKDSVENVEPILCTADDPKLEKASCDLIVMVDVYHELEFPKEVGEKLAAALKPGGRVAFVEFRKEDPKVPIKEVHKMAERQVIKEAEALGLKHVKTVNTLPWQHVVFCEKPK